MGESKEMYFDLLTHLAACFMFGMTFSYLSTCQVGSLSKDYKTKDSSLIHWGNDCTIQCLKRNNTVW